MKKLAKNLLIVIAIAAFVVSCSQKPKESEQAVVEQEVTIPLGEVSYEGDSITMNGYFAFDNSNMDKRPGVLVVHEWWGHNEYARQRADMLADLGYVALAVDMYGDGKTAQHPDDAGTFAMAVMSDPDGAVERFNSAYETLKSHPAVDPSKIAAIGYCFGGSVVLTMANTGADLDAVAAFHAGVQLPVQPEPGSVKAKVLVCNGADDPFITEEQVAAYKEAMDAAGADYNYIAYEGAVHSFTSQIADSVGQLFELPLAYNEEADKASWEEMQKLFAEVF